MTTDTKRTRKPRRNPIREMERLESYLEIMIRVKSEPIADASNNLTASTEGQLKAYRDVLSYLAEIHGKENGK